jgi:hypothetical protein
MTKLLDEAIATIRTLPEEEQDLAAEMLRLIADRAKGTYVMSPDERRVVEAALAETDGGTFASDEEVEALLNKPWV